jgi:hypothetical protein
MPVPRRKARVERAPVSMPPLLARASIAPPARHGVIPATQQHRSLSLAGARLDRGAKADIDRDAHPCAVNHGVGRDASATLFELLADAIDGQAFTSNTVRIAEQIAIARRPVLEPGHHEHRALEHKALGFLALRR